MGLPEGFEIINDPVALASDVAMMGFHDKSFTGSARDHNNLIALTDASRKCGYMTSWTVKALRGFVAPFSPEPDQEATVHIVDGLYFEGEFDGFSRFSMGRELGEGAVRALCMTFPTANLVTPSSVPLDDNDLLLVPVLAVESIERIC